MPITSEHKQKILSVLIALAPNHEAQGAVIKALREIEEGCTTAGLPDREELRQIVNILADGLNYGSWPWVKVGG